MVYCILLCCVICFILDHMVCNDVYIHILQYMALRHYVSNQVILLCFGPRWTMPIARCISDWGGYIHDFETKMHPPSNPVGLVRKSSNSLRSQQFVPLSSESFIHQMQLWNVCPGLQVFLVCSCVLHHPTPEQCMHCIWAEVPRNQHRDDKHWWTVAAVWLWRERLNWPGRICHWWLIWSNLVESCGFIKVLVMASRNVKKDLFWYEYEGIKWPLQPFWWKLIGCLSVVQYHLTVHCKVSSNFMVKLVALTSTSSEKKWERRSHDLTCTSAWAWAWRWETEFMQFMQWNLQKCERYKTLPTKRWWVTLSKDEYTYILLQKKVCFHEYPCYII